MGVSNVYGIPKVLNEQAWKQECLERWKEARRILSLPHSKRRPAIDAIEKMKGEAWAELLKKEIKRQHGSR